MKKKSFFTTVKILIVIAILAQTTELRSFDIPYLSAPIAQAAGATITWDGGGGDNNASTAANWSGDALPTAGDNIVFDGTSTKAVTWNLSAATTFGTFTMSSAYTSTMTLNTSLNTGTFTMNGGTITFNAVSISITTSGDMIIGDGSHVATINSTANSSAETYKVVLNVTGNLTVAASSTIIVDGKGYSGTGGTGKGTSAGEGGGGAYGGDGGTGTNGGTGGTGYGSVTAPTNIGSPGGNSGGEGGGAIQATASGTITVSGIVSANGNAAPSNGKGGGSGGSVYLTAATITGGGTIRANGGTGGGAGCCNWGGGGGGGGRIALYYTTNTFSGTNTAYGGNRTGLSATYGAAGTIYLKDAMATNGDLVLDNNSNSTSSYTRILSTRSFDNLTVKNAASYLVPTSVTNTIATAFTNGNSTGIITVNSGGTLVLPPTGFAGAPGTFYNAGTVNSASTLTVTSGVTFNHQSGASLPDMTALTLTGGTFVQTGNIGSSNSISGAITVTSGTYTINHANAITTTGLTVSNTGTINSSANTSAESYKVNITVNGNADIQSGGAINVDGKGYSGTSGTGKGTSAGEGGGGAYGGDGGTGTNGGTGGTGYGSTTAPTNIGSPGGNSGGAGGGAIQLAVSGTLTVAGTVSANGSAAPGNGTGGGSGGSVYLTAATITGGGTIRANGGTGGGAGCCNYGAGGGGGGRVALYYTANTFSGTSSAYSGARGSVNATPGGAGTVYLKSAAATYGDLILDSNSPSGTAASTRQLASATFSNLSIKNGAQYLIPSGSTTTVATALTNGSATSGITVNSGGTLDISACTLTGGPGTISNSGTINTGSSFAVPSGVTFNHNSGAALPNVATFTDSGTFVWSGGTTPSLTTMTVGGTFTFNTGSTLSLTTLTVPSGGLINSSANSSAETYKVNITVSGNADIQSGGTINVDGKGYTAGNGTGKGTNPGGQQGGGGAYGGDGGTGTNTGTGGTGYGSITAPTNIGSPGGGSGSPGSGGGAIRLTVSGTLTVNGTLTANGNNGPTDNGGGSGGSIYLDATSGTITGGGTIRANGGTGGGGGCCNYGAGGGGGGRIALYYTTNTFSGTNSAYSGARGSINSTPGGAGTIYLKSTAATNGDLVMNANSPSGTAASTRINGTFQDISTLNGAIALMVTSNLVASRNVSIGSSTTLNANSLTFTVGGNFANSGTFTAGTSSVVFNTAGTTSNVSGSSTFYNLLCTTAGKNITFAAGTTQTISNALTLTGSAGSYVTLRSSSNGSYWNINPQGTRSVSYADVKDSNNANVTAITATNTLDSGHNNNWTISGPPPTDPIINNYNSGAYTNDNTPTLSFDLADPNNVTVKYRIQIDDTSNFSSTIIDETEGSYSASPRSNVNYTPVALSDGSYYWRVMTLNSNGQSSSWTVANSGSVAFRVDATAPTSPTISINSGEGYATSTSATLSLSASDATSGVADMIISENADFSGAAWETYATSKAFTLSSGDGVKTVYVKFRDAVGNESASTSDSIVYDITAPSGTITINTADAYTSATGVTVAISASDVTSGMYQMEISEDSGFLGASWESYATSKSFTLTGLDGTHTVYIRFKDNAGNISMATSDDIILDTAAPTGSVSINAGASNSNTRSVTLTIGALDSTSGVSQMEVSESAVFSGASYEAYATSKAFTLSATDGIHTVYVRFKDAAGNVSSSYSDTIVLDRSGPIVTAFSINSDAAYATSNDVTLTVGAFDISTSTDEMMISESGSFVGAAWEPYATSKSFTLSDGDGLKTVYIKFRDSAGNSSLPTYDAITLDTTMPDGSVTINSGDGYTQLRDVTLELSSSDNLGPVSLMRISEDASFDGVAWEAHATTKDYTLSADDGTKTVFVEFQDDAGNTSSAVSDSITYDATVPASNSISINGGASTTSTPGVTLTLSSTDDTSGTVLMEISEDASFTGASWELYATSKSLTLSDGDGVKTVYARFKDAAGNISSGVSDTIILDTENPSGSITINGGDALTSVRTVTLTLSAADATTEVVEMEISENSGFVGASWEAYATTKSFTLSATDGVKTVYARFKDAAGNVSSADSDTIEFDSTAPGINSFVINDNDTYANARSVILAISASDSGGGISQMMISNAADFSGATWESYTTTKAWTLLDLDGAQTVYIKFRDSILNVSDTTSDSIILDQAYPSGTIVINSDDVYTSSRIVTVGLSASDATSGLYKMMLSDDAAFTGASWEDYNTSRSYTLDTTDGTKTLYAKFMDNAGNVSSVATDTIIQDTTGPVLTYVKLNNDATYTNSRSVTVKVESTDATTSVDSMMFSLSNTFLLAEWQPYATEFPLTLTSGDGVKTVYVKFKDAQGNISSTIQASITLDMTAPTGTITMNAGADKTTSRDVVLALQANDATSGVSSMRISELSTLSDASLESYAPSKTLTLSSAEGTKTLYVEYRDAAGNVSSVVSDTITYAVQTNADTDTNSDGSSGSGSDSSGGGGSSGGSESPGSGSGSGNGSSGGDEPIIETTSLTLRVLDKDNKPVPNAKVILADGTVAFTDENGVVTFENVTEGETNVRIEYGDTVEEKRVTISSNQGEIAVVLSKNAPSQRPYATTVKIAAGVAVAGIGVTALQLRFRKRRKRRL